MLTQMELMGSNGGLGMDEERSDSSPLDDLPQYPLEHAEFEYFETSLGDGDSYYDVPSLTVPGSLNTPDYSAQADIYDTEINAVNKFQELDQFSPQIYQDLKPQQELKSEDELKFANIYEDLKSQELKFPESLMQYQGVSDEVKLEDGMSYDEFSGKFCDEGIGTSSQGDEFGLSGFGDGIDLEQSHTMEVATQAGWTQGATSPSGKGKIDPLQRQALDSIFMLTEKPSRGMALHIASELGLHYVTVKNFFSNGRRRLRRAAAKLTNPERSRRETERRKEKRRLMASAAALSDGKPVSIRRLVTHTQPPSPVKESPVVSPERKALMEKLADKVQRSVAQRSLAAELDMVQPNAILTQTPKYSAIELLGEVASDMSSSLLQNTILSPDEVLINPSPQDFLTNNADLNSVPPLLNPNDPWNIF